MDKLVFLFSKRIFPSNPVTGTLGCINMNCKLLQYTGIPLFGAKHEFKLPIFIFGLLFITLVRIPYHIFQIYDLIICYSIYEDMLQNLCMLLLHLAVSIKTIMVFSCLKDIRKIIRQFQLLTMKYVRSKEQKDVFFWMEFENKISITAYALFAAMTSVFGITLTIKNPSVVGQIFPYRAKMPDIVPFAFQVFYIPFSNAAIGFQIVGIDYLNVAFINLTRCQLRILNLSFDELNETKFGKFRGEPLTHLIRLVEHHTDILKIRNQIEDIFKFPMLIQIAASLLVFALTIYQVLEPSGNSGLVMIYMYVGCLFAELIVYCWFGTEVSEQNKTLAIQGYETSWYNFDFKYRKALVIFLMNAQRPFHFTAGGYFKLSLSTFSTIISKAFSLVAVLRQRYTD